MVDVSYSCGFVVFGCWTLWLKFFNCLSLCFYTCQKMSFCLVLFFPFGIKIYCINAYVFRFVVNLLYMTPGITEFIKSILSWWYIIFFFIYSFHYLKYFNNMSIFILKSWRDKTNWGWVRRLLVRFFIIRSITEESTFQRR